MLAYGYNNYYDFSGYSKEELLIALGVMIVILIVAIAALIWCCVLSYRMAVDRGQSGGLWVFIALMIGWLAVIILACMPKHEPDYYHSTRGRLAKLSQESEKERVNSWICENCGWKNPITASTCKSCYKARPASALAEYQKYNEAHKKTEVSDGSWYCSHCGTKNTRTYTYCKACYKKKPKD